MRVLVVDDDPAGGWALAALLRAEGIQAHVIDDAELALEMLLLLPIDLLIVDMRLPGMTGPEMVRVLRRAGSTIPAILVSAADTDEIAAAAGSSGVDLQNGGHVAGVNAWLPKPLDRVTLLQTIEEVITRRSSLPPLSIR